MEPGPERPPGETLGLGSAKLEEVRRRRRSQRRRRVSGVVALAAAAAAGVWIYRERPWQQTVEEGPAEDVTSVPGPPAAFVPPASPAPTSEPPATGPVAVAVGEPLPTLDQSDGWVRQEAGRLSSSPLAKRALGGKDLVRRIVAVVDNVADGRDPRTHVLELAPSGRFAVRRRDDQLWIDPASYRRYDALAGAFAALDSAATANLYSRLEPLLNVAYTQLGHPDGDFAGRVRQAFAELLATPQVDGPVAVVPRGATAYAFADSRLEDLSPAQKQLLRMGPVNQRRIQAKLRELAEALSVASNPFPATPTLHPGR